MMVCMVTSDMMSMFQDGLHGSIRYDVYVFMMVCMVPPDMMDMFHDGLHGSIRIDGYVP